MNLKKIGMLFLGIVFLSASFVFADGGTKEDAVSRVIRPGDILKINVWKYSDLNATLTVTPEGYISYMYLGDISVAGKTVEDLRKLVTEKLDKNYVVNPQVDIQVETKSTLVFVVGEVVRPGSYPFQPGLDPIKAVALAGGLSDFASFKASIVRTDLNGKDIQIDADLKSLMKANSDRGEYLLQPGDMVVVKRSWF